MTRADERTATRAEAADGPPAATDWDAYWQSDLDTKEWEYLHEVIFHVLQREFAAQAQGIPPSPAVAGPASTAGNRGAPLPIVELGCGSGRISLGLARAGHRVLLMDRSMEALKVSRARFQANGQQPVGVVQADIRHLPFRRGLFEAMWNAGVLEHFDTATQSAILDGCGQSLRPGGVFVTLNPNARSLLHSFGRWFIQRVTVYPFEDEGLVRTLQPLVPQGASCTEYSVGFVDLLPGMFKRLMLIRSCKRVAGWGFRAVDGFFCAVSRTFVGDWLEALDHFLSRLLGGYLVVSVIRKESTR